MRPVLRDHAADRARGREQMILADNIGERLWPEAIRERPRRVFLKASGFEQIGHT
jgi:hypothetical protein